MSATAISLRVRPADWAGHLYALELHVTSPQVDQVVSLPVWIPGSYLVREFARHLQDLSAQQGQQPCSVTALDKCTWRIACQAGQPLTLRYRVYAFDASVRTAWLDAERAFFNATSLCLRVHGCTDRAHQLELSRADWPQDWSLACTLRPVRTDAQGWGSWQAADYDALADAPVALGRFWQGQFVLRGVPHQVLVQGAAPSFDGERLLADTQAICAAEIDFWHPQPDAAPPQRQYLFHLAALASGWGGLEHANGCALIAPRADLPRADTPAQPDAQHAYTRLLGLISHEYFHTWNVKRLRPPEFVSYDYSRENHTPWLWFFEGLTSYYDDLLLLRSARISTPSYLGLLGQTVRGVWASPGRQVQSLAQASWDAWTKFYRPDENTANASVNYYTQGALVGLCLDLSLRLAGSSLEDVLRALWQRCSTTALHESDLRDELARAAGRPLDAELDAWVYGLTELPLPSLLASFGVRCNTTAAPWDERLGLRLCAGEGLRLQSVRSGGAAHQAGLAAGDEWLGLELSDQQSWRLRRLEDLSCYLPAPPHNDADLECRILVARNDRLMHLPLRVPGPQSAAARQIELVLDDPVRAQIWLQCPNPAPAPSP